MVKAYCGVGSRSTPAPILDAMSRVAERLAGLRHHLRSGGADGADKAFERGAGCGGGTADIFLPWPGFNGYPKEPTSGSLSTYPSPTEAAVQIAQRHHPAWRTLTRPVRRLMARNVHQVLGYDCDTPASFVLCWTPDGAETVTTAKTGGTGMAIRVAVAHGVPVVNMALDGWESRLAALL